MKTAPPIASLAVLVAIACSTSSSSDSGTTFPPRVRPPNLGVTGASASCVINQVDTRVGLTCDLQATGTAPPPTLRMALVWSRTQKDKGVVVEYGERSTIPAPFAIDLPLPPREAIEPTAAPPGYTLQPGAAKGVAIGFFVIYEDGNDDQKLNLVSRGERESPDRVLGVARHLILFYEGGADPGLHIEEATPSPDMEDCVEAPCKMPFDAGSFLLAPGTPIEIVAVAAHTSQRYLCDPFPGISQPWESTAYCSAPQGPGEGLVCAAGDALIGHCDPTPGVCEQQSCTFCRLNLGDPLNPCD